jgi:hypothetical protein
MRKIMIATKIQSKDSRAVLRAALHILFGPDITRFPGKSLPE